MKIPALIIYVLLILAGCAAHSGIVQIGADTFMVSKQAEADISDLSILRGEALEEAYLFCTSQNRLMRVVGITEFLPPDISRGLPKVEAQFLCLEETDPRLTDPSLQESPDAMRIILE